MGEEGTLAESIEQQQTSTVVAEVRDHQLPPKLQDLADEYEVRIGHRDRFLIKWLHVVFPFFRLPSVSESNLVVARTNKTLLAWYVTILDDIGEHENSRETLTEAAKIPHPDESADPDKPGVDEDYLDVAGAFWRQFESRIRAAPRYDAVASQLRYDLRKVTQAVRYSMLINEEPARASLREAKLADSHNMMMLLLADVDIAYSDAFDVTELGRVRDFVHEIQLLARIGNWLTTWERETDEGDVSCGVFALALEEGVVSPAELRAVGRDPDADERVKRTIRESTVEEQLQDMWQETYVGLRTDPPELGSIDVDEILDGMSRLRTYQEACKDLK